MEILKKLSPSETYLILNNTRIEYNELLKLTLAQLLLTKVLKVEKRISQVTLGDSEITLAYVMRGENWSHSIIKPYERVFTQPFEQSQELEILFHQLVKIGYENGNGRYMFTSKVIRKNSNLNTYLKKNPLLRLFDPAPLNKLGEEARKSIQSHLQTIGNKLTQAISLNNRGQVLDILNEIGGNIYLIKELDSEILKEIDEVLKENKDLQTAYNDYGCGSYFGSYYGTSDSFDSAYDSVSDSSGSGCGGDSGCSGCGGCGGCGS